MTDRTSRGVSPPGAGADLHVGLVVGLFPAGQVFAFAAAVGRHEPGARIAAVGKRHGLAHGGLRAGLPEVTRSAGEVGRPWRGIASTGTAGYCARTVRRHVAADTAVVEADCAAGPENAASAYAVCGRVAIDVGPDQIDGAAEIDDPTTITRAVFVDVAVPDRQLASCVGDSSP